MNIRTAHAVLVDTPNGRVEVSGFNRDAVEYAAKQIERPEYDRNALPSTDQVFDWLKVAARQLNLGGR